MGEIKISVMDAATTVIATDVVVGVNDSATKSITTEKILMVKSLTAIRWDDIRVSAISIKTGGSKDPDFVKVVDDGSGSQGIFTYAFDKITEEELYFNIELPHNWKVGTDIHAHAHWMPKDTNTGTIQWGLEYSIAELDAVYGNSTIILSSATAAPGVALTQKVLEIGSIDMSGVSILSALIICRIFRNVAVDTYDNDAYLLEIDFHYEVDSLGSAEQYVK